MTPENIRKARLAAGLTQAQAARLVGLGARERWTEYECGTRRISPRMWQMFNLKTGGKS